MGDNLNNDIKQAPKKQILPNTAGTQRVDFLSDEFDTLVFNKGLEVVHEGAVVCPCKSQGRNYLPNCLNCGGTGFVFVNPMDTKMVLTSLNRQTKYTDWTIEKAGTVNITARSVDILSDMDRITLKNSVSRFSQVLYPNIFETEPFAFTSYNIIKIHCVFEFIASDKKLKLIPSNYYTFNKNKLILDKKIFKPDMTLSVRFDHLIQYHIIDLVREVRDSMAIDISGRDKGVRLPLTAVGRRVHYVLNPSEFSGTTVFENSYASD